MTFVFMGICFGAIAFQSIRRLYEIITSSIQGGPTTASAVRGGYRWLNIVFVFNGLILTTAFTRCVWLLMPGDLLEKSYPFEYLNAYQYTGWWQSLVSISLLDVGTLSLYGVFILVCCYWRNILKKLDTRTSDTTVSGSSLLGGSSGSGSGSSNDYTAHTNAPKRPVLKLFTAVMIGLCSVLIVVALLFVKGFYSFEFYLCFSCLFFAALSIALIFIVTSLGGQIKEVLYNIELVNRTNSQPQIRRIQAMEKVALIFFASTAFLEAALGLHVAKELVANRGLGDLLADKNWAIYIRVKHTLEIIVLGLQMLISTSIQVYDNSIPASTAIRRAAVNSSSSTIYTSSYNASGNNNSTNTPHRMAYKATVSTPNSTSTIGGGVGGGLLKTTARLPPQSQSQPQPPQQAYSLVPTAINTEEDMGYYNSRSNTAAEDIELVREIASSRNNVTKNTSAPPPSERTPLYSSSSRTKDDGANYV